MSHWYEAWQVSRITPLLYVGNVSDAKNLVLDNPSSIRSVLNVSTEPAYEKHPEIHYVNLPFPDGYEIPMPTLQRCMDYLRFQSDLGHSTLIHCAAGISRSPSVCACWLAYSKQMNLEQAILHITAIRNIVQPHPDILRSVKQFLQVWPYDGSFNKIETQQLPVLKLNAEQFQKLLIAHPDPLCPVRNLYLRMETKHGQQMHETQCECNKPSI